jgi:hypothetical protein
MCFPTTRNLSVRAFARATVAAVVICGLVAFNHAASAQNAGRLSVRVHTDAGVAIPGAAIRVEHDGKIVAESLTGGDGKAAVLPLAAAGYKITIAAEGFEQLAESILISDERQEIEMEFTLVSKIRRTDSIDVVADAEQINFQETSPAATELKSADVAVLPLRPSTVTDTLPLVPGVTRTSDGEIQIGGQGEQRSALLVNGSDVTDPATGRFGTTLPADSVQSVEVLKTPFLPQYGGFTTGVVAVETRRGGDQWHFTLKEFIPSFRIRSGHIRGLRDALPRLSFSGPILKNKLFFSESVQYRFEKRQVRTLSFPHNESKDELVNSFSQFDFIISPAHFVTASAHVTPHHINFVDPQFFNPQPVTPSFRGYDATFTATDHLTLFGGLLDSKVSRQQFRTRVGAQGEAEMVLTPTGNLGNYFGRRTRDASRTEWTESFSINKGSAHALKFGSATARLTNSGSFDFRPVEIRDINGQLLERIEFTPGSSFQKSDTEQSFFVQDHYTIRPNLALDGGGRVEYQARTSTVRLAPRIAGVWNPFPHDPMVFRAGWGVFYDRVPLAVYSFGHRPEHIVTTFDASGPVQRRFSNMMDFDSGNGFPLVRRGLDRGNFAPYSTTWSAEIERAFGRVLHIRTNYQHSNAGGSILLTPRQTEGKNFYALGAGGRSTYRQLEVTARMSLERGQQLIFSYVRSKAVGDLNIFTTYLGDYPVVPLRPNYYTNTRGDIPNRFLLWGVVNLPWDVRLAPIFEYRTGQPYAIVEARRHYVGIPFSDATRFRNFVTLDERMSKDVRLLTKYKARLSISVLNVLNHFNPLDVHTNTADPQLGVFFGHYKRRYRADFEIVF